MFRNSLPILPPQSFSPSSSSWPHRLKSIPRNQFSSRLEDDSFFPTSFSIYRNCIVRHYIGERHGGDRCFWCPAQSRRKPSRFHFLLSSDMLMQGGKTLPLNGSKPIFATTKMVLICGITYLTAPLYPPFSCFSSYPSGSTSLLPV